jgi:diacylglycerol kinase family enzyme
MVIDGVEATPTGDIPFRSYGFAVAVGGIGQRFFAKYYEDSDPRPSTIVKVVTRALLSLPASVTPLRRMGFGSYAREIFEPTPAKISLDGMILPGTEFTGIHVASMSINLGGVLRFFGQADQRGLMNAIIGSPSPLGIAMNLPRMVRGAELRGRNVLDRPCRELTVEATTDALLEPVIDGEYYRGLRKVSFRIGPRVRIPKLAAPAYA